MTLPKELRAKFESCSPKGQGNLMFFCLSPAVVLYSIAKFFILFNTAACLPFLMQSLRTCQSYRLWETKSIFWLVLFLHVITLICCCSFYKQSMLRTRMPGHHLGKEEKKLRFVTFIRCNVALETWKSYYLHTMHVHCMHVHVGHTNYITQRRIFSGHE